MKKLRFTFKYRLPPELRGLKIPEDDPQTRYPFMPIYLYNGEKKTVLLEGLIDSGSDYLFIPKGLADFLNLSKGKKEEISGVCGSCNAIETQVGLVLGRGGKNREMDYGCVKTFFPEKERNMPILIGRYPIFEEYQVIFEEYKKRFKLIPKEEILEKEKRQSKTKWKF